MPVDYKLVIKNTAGTVQAEIVGAGASSSARTRGGFLSLVCSKGVNQPGLLKFSLDAESDAAAYLTDMAQIELWRRWPEQDIAWYAFFYGIFRDDIRQQDEDGKDIIEAQCPGILSILSWRLNAYDAGTSNKTSYATVAAETIMKSLITNNFTSTATTGNGRDRDGVSGGTVNGFTIAVAADAAGGNALSVKNITRKPVLPCLQGIVDAGSGGDFNLVKTAASTYEFRFYSGQLGTDRTATVTFSPEIGNMLEPKLARIRSAEATAIIVGGGGQESRRTIVVRTGGNYNVSTNNIEAFADGASTTSGTTNTATLNAIGDKKATERRMRAKLDYDVSQVALLLDRDYFLGDKVTARYASTTFTQQIYTIAMDWRREQGERIEIGMRDV